MTKVLLNTLKSGDKFLLRVSLESSDITRYELMEVQQTAATSYACTNPSGELCYLDVDTLVAKLET